MKTLPKMTNEIYHKYQTVLENRIDTISDSIVTLIKILENHGIKDTKLEHIIEDLNNASADHMEETLKTWNIR